MKCLLRSIDHVQLAIPSGQEAKAREFYLGFLGLEEKAKPPELAGRGGLWFEAGAVKVHLGLEPEFRPSQKAHVAFWAEELRSLAQTAAQRGYRTSAGETIDGFARIYVYDPFGNRLEFIEASR